MSINKQDFSQTDWLEFYPAWVYKVNWKPVSKVVSFRD